MNIINALKDYRADWVDVGLIKIAVFAGTLFIAKLWNSILGLDWYWCLLVWIIAAIKPLMTFSQWIKLAENK
jgi:hypothetical protein